MQTHRTIIFEKFNDSPGQPDLCTIINNDPSDDRLAMEIEDKLLVKSFDEFMEKFAPDVYEVAGRDADGKPQLFYTTDPTRFPDCRFVTIKFVDHSFYKMLVQLYSTRGSAGQANRKFDDKEIMEMLTPKKELEDVRDLRRKLEYNMQLFHEAKARGDKSAMKDARDKSNAAMKKINQFATSPLNALVPIILEDVNTKLNLLGQGVSTSGDDDAPKALPTYGQLYLNEAGQLDILDNKKFSALQALPSGDEKNGGSLIVSGNNLPTQITTLPADPTQKKSSSPVPDTQTLHNQIADAIVRGYEKNATMKNDRIKSLIVSTFAPLATVVKSEDVALSKEQLLAQRAEFENIYANARQSFANEMCRIVESLLGVKTFFDHATIDGGDFSEVPAGVIISNCKASKFLKIEDKFAARMKHLGKAQGENSRIWFAIVPSVFEEPPTTNSTEDISDDLFSDDDEDTSEESGEDYVSLNAVKKFLKLMDDAKIMTVFNVRVKKNNTFADLTADEIRSKIETFDACKYGHAVYAYPNFTLLNERDIEPFDDDVKISLPGVFIDAAYPAAGLLVAAQQLKILESRKLKVDKDSACVGVDYEELQVKKKLPTKFNRESLLRRNEDLIRTINENMFGFAFSGDEVKDEDGTWKNSYVHCARTLAKSKKTGNYKPIYQTLVEDFISMELKLMPSKKRTDVKKFIDKVNREWAAKNDRDTYKGCANFLLRAGEEIQLEEDGGKIKVKINFAGGDGYVDVDVESD